MAFEVMVSFAIGSFTYLIYHECQSCQSHHSDYTILPPITPTQVVHFECFILSTLSSITMTFNEMSPPSHSKSDDKSLDIALLFYSMLKISITQRNPSVYGEGQTPPQGQTSDRRVCLAKSDSTINVQGYVYIGGSQVL